MWISEAQAIFSTRIKDAGIAIRHSRGRILFYTAGSRNGLERVVGDGPRGWTSGDADTKRKLTLRKIHFFVMEKYIEDVRQKEKDVPDLLESIMRPTWLVNEELRPNLMKMTQFRPKIQKIKVSTFWIPEIRCFPAGGQCQASRPQVLSNIWPR